MIYVQVISSPPPLWNTGGTARQSDALIKLMAENATVILVTQRNHANLAREYFKDYENIHVFETYVDFSKVKPISILKIKKLEASIKSLMLSENQKVVVHCMESKSLLTVQMAILCRYKKFEFWLSPFGQGSTILNGKLSIIKYLYKKIIKQADTIICQNLDEFQLFKSNSKSNNICEIPLLIDPELNKQVQSIKGKNPQTIKIGFLGRNTKLKGIIQIIDFVHKVSSHVNLEFSLALSGTDPDVDSAILNSKIDIDVLRVDNSFDRIAYYKNLDVFIILPTVQEETSLAALEAALLGCKIIYNRNCLFSNEEMFGDICCLIENFSVEWLMRKSDTASYDRILEYYNEIIPNKYRKLVND